jgi:hypothetical protein
MHEGIWWKRQKEREQWGGIHVDEGIILGWVLDAKEGCYGLDWYRASDEFCEQGNEPSHSINCGKYLSRWANGGFREGLKSVYTISGWLHCKPSLRHHQQHRANWLEQQRLSLLWIELSWSCDRRSVGLFVLVSGNPLGPMTKFFFFLSFAGQFICSSFWGALSDERTGL